jgi:hypothetical protein
MTDRPRALAVLISVFFAGCIIGALGFSVWARKHPEFPAIRATTPAIGSQRRGGGPRQWFFQMLQLTPEQEKLVSKIMDERRSRFDVLEKEYAPKYDGLRAQQEPQAKAIMADVNNKISAVLNETQKKKFTEMQKRFEERRGRGPRREGGFGMTPPPPQ